MESDAIPTSSVVHQGGTQPCYIRQLSLSDVLRDVPVDHSLSLVVQSLSKSCAEIAELLRSETLALNPAASAGTSNTFGDTQLEADLRANDIIMRHLRNSGAVAVASSEEQPDEIPITSSPQANYAVAFDPLDGSSIISCNWSVGTIFGVWPGSQLVGRSGNEMVVGGCAVYGPRTTMYIALKGCDSALEFTLRGGEVDHLSGSAWYLSKKIHEIGPGKLFAPANMRAARHNSGYKSLLEFYMSAGYTLRYTGGMVPDVTQILVKGHGVFASPVSDHAPAKLRLLYEAIPMAFLVERAGGASTDGKISMLSRLVTACDERTPVCVGSREEVARYTKFCGSG